MAIRQQIKRRAWRRFILGYPPRKQTDTSIGDALNWEWIVHCGQNIPGKIVIVSRDSDYGSSVRKEYFLNDQLLREYRDRVGAGKSIGYTHKLSDALQELQVKVPQKEIEAEAESMEDREREALAQDLPAASRNRIGHISFEEFLRLLKGRSLDAHSPATVESDA
jgi:hypothetical protein